MAISAQTGETTRLAGLDISTASRDRLARLMVADCLAARRAETPRPRLVFDVNGHALSLREQDPAYRTALGSADVVHADGGFLVTLSRFLPGPTIAERSATTDLVHDLAAHAAANGLRLFLLGATETVNAEAARRLSLTHPGLVIAGRRNGYFAPEDETSIVEAIRTARADLVLVGLGKPKEQIFALHLRDRVGCGWIVTCGGCLDFLAGTYRRAPLWMQRANLEWLHRMATGPRYLVGRYLRTIPHALLVVLRGTPRSRQG
ncbi:WecB/TagA/CpsF family glycosyltransferase [Pelagibacterium montanilacus]|uniref:WecB/TagA/CpsF family glycosyltransferase n=1 Tax=Pelagibacterium montanilacus TaxID=2185280 RepID=UPI0019CFF0E7|nr:WecB/TagA/CpsF family glycosyltransferase [Pelagibacterium montanilacus]